MRKTGILAQTIGLNLSKKYLDVFSLAWEVLYPFALKMILNVKLPSLYYDNFYYFHKLFINESENKHPETQLTFTSSKSAIETLEKRVKYDAFDVVLVLLLLALDIFHIFF